MLSVQKKMDYRSRGIANGDTGDKTGVSSPNLFSLKKTDIKLAFINRSIRRFEWEKKLKVRPNARIKVGQICICPNFTEHESGESIALTQRNDRAFLHDLEKRTFVWQSAITRREVKRVKNFHPTRTRFIIPRISRNSA